MVTIFNMPELRPYTDVMSGQETKRGDVMTPAQARNPAVNIPGVFSQTTALFRPVDVSSMNKDGNK